MQNIVLNLERKSKRDIVAAANDYQETQTRTQSELQRKSILFCVRNMQ